MGSEMCIRDRNKGNLFRGYFAKGCELWNQCRACACHRPARKANHHFENSIGFHDRKCPKTNSVHLIGVCTLVKQTRCTCGRSCCSGLSTIGCLHQLAPDQLPMVPCARHLDWLAKCSDMGRNCHQFPLGQNHATSFLTALNTAAISKSVEDGKRFRSRLPRNRLSTCGSFCLPF